jgi:hypothetical protein
MRRAQDSVNPRTHPDIMVHAHEDEEGDDDPHPYWYARVQGGAKKKEKYTGLKSNAE